MQPTSQTTLFVLPKIFYPTPNLFADQIWRAAQSLRAFILVAAVSVMGIVPSNGAAALELGLTPSHVYSTWTNINAALIAVARTMSDDPTWRKQIVDMKVQRFSGKNPGDVFAKVDAFRDTFHKGRSDGPSLQGWEDHGTNKEVTPSMVFLNSGLALGGVVSWLVDQSSRQQLVSQFFTRHGFTKKIPSDVFGLVDLAYRRLELILTK